MLGIAIRFDLGRYHANPWGSNVNDAATEWPPSPWRLIRALYSTARTNTRLQPRRAHIDRGLAALIAAPPPVFELPEAIAAHTRHYMPKARYSAMNPGETAKVIDAFLAVDPAAEIRAWWETSMDGDALDGLRAAVDALGYLGRSESVCSARLITEGSPENVAAAPLDTDAASDQGRNLTELLCPDPSHPLDTVGASVATLRMERRRIPVGARYITYTAPHTDDSSPAPALPRRARRPEPTLALLRVAGRHRPALHDAVAVGQALRRGLQGRFGNDNSKAASTTFSGRNGDEPRKDQHRHAHYLCLPDGHGRRVGHVAVWAPEGFGGSEVAALARLEYLRMHGVETIQTALALLGDTEQLDLPELLGPSRSWQSLTPFGLVRHPKVRNGVTIDSPEDQIRRELAHRERPQPDEIELDKGSWHRFRSSKVGTSRLSRVSLYGVTIHFSEPVSGPIALGALSHYGLGLMRPND